MDKSKLTDMNRRFDVRLNELISLKGQNTQFFTSKSYTEMIEKVKCSKSKISKKKPEDYQRLRRFDVMTIGETEKLIVPVKEDKTIRFYVKNDEIFQILHDAHVAVGHGGRNRMEKELNWRFKNITREMIAIYLNLCDDCEKKRNVPKKASVVKPVLNNEIHARCQVDLIDMQSQDDQYKFILVYRDHRTEFVQLRPLKTNTAKEVAYVLLDIFTIFGAPSILNSDNGRLFAHEIVQEACNMWPELKIIHGKPRQSQSQGSVENPNQYIENILRTWLKDNSTSTWSKGLRFVQLTLNSAHHTGINSTPYEAMFGKKLKVGLKSSSLPHAALLDINSEEDLEKLLFPESTVTENGQVESMETDHVESTGNYTHLFSPIITLDVQSEETSHSNTDRILANEITSSEQNVGAKEEKVMPNLQTRITEMWNASNSKYHNVKIGDSVRVRLSDGDRVHSDGRKLLATVIEITPSNLYKLSTKQGVLNEFYSRNQFTVCRKRFVSPTDTEISISESARIKHEIVDSNRTFDLS